VVKPGEYIGKDGATYCWMHLDDGYEHCGPHAFGWSRNPAIKPENLLAAKAALDALIEEEAGEWVEWTVPEDRGSFRYRCKTDGTEAEINEGRGWKILASEIAAREFYRAGLKVGREEARELAEAVRRNHARELAKKLTP
jgi:hypothetical protein